VNRFAGKFSFYYNDYKLIFFDSRVGLVHKANRKFKLPGSEPRKEVDLPEYASQFLAYERMDGWVVLQAFNGQIVAFGGELLDEIVPSTTPTGNPRYPVKVYTAYFDLSLIRGARADGSWKTRLAFKRPEATQTGVTNLLPRYAVPQDLDYSPIQYGVTNITSHPTKPATLFTIEQHADGVRDMTAGTKKVERYDFRSFGEARVDLSGEDLNGIDFGYADFTGANLKGTKFNNGKFARARFTSTNLDGADFTGANLDTADFSHGKSMEGTILTGVTGKSCDFSHCDLRTVVAATALNLESPEGAPARFSYAKLKYALVGPKWTNRHFEYVVMEALPATVSNLDAQKAVLTGMDLGGLNASSAKFNKATLHAVGFTGAKLFGATFDEARLEGLALPDGSAIAAADFTGADLSGASFANANVSGVSFVGAVLEEGVFTAATVRGAVFNNAYMKAVNFSAVEQKLMHGTKFGYACLIGCNFQGADLSVDVNLARAYLHGADFSNAKLGGANLADAGIAFASGELTVKLPGEEEKTVAYDPTIIDAAVCTSNTTRCPNGDLGPCTGDKLKTRNAFPTSWPFPGRRVWSEEEDQEEVDLVGQGGFEPPTT
jgi:uncharacterized protein YjbI with pentapeptide repeats